MRSTQVNALDTGIFTEYTQAMTPTQLKRTRKELGLTQEQLGEALGVARITIAQWEGGTRGISEPIARLVQRIAAEARAKRKR